MTDCRPAVLVLFVLSINCGGSPQKGARPEVLIQVADDGTAPEDTARATTSGNAIEDRLETDVRLAYEAIGRSIDGADPDLAALAAAYALRLGLKHDNQKIAAALKKGVLSEVPFLVALSWRWLLDVSSVIEVSAEQSAYPVVSMIRALFELSRGQVPDAEVSQFIHCPAPGSRSYQASSGARERAVELTTRLRPFDNGVLALALAMFESRRYRWAELNESGELILSCYRLRNELFTALNLAEDTVAQLAAPDPMVIPSGRSGVTPELENPMIGSPVVSLRGAVLSGPKDVRISALRAMIIVIKEPEFQDLGAAAAALESNDASLQLEAARTLLYLVARMQQEQN